jgi:hypothetical protein
MTRDEQCKLLEDNGWEIINKNPLEIQKHENGKLVAKAFGQAAFTIAYHLEKDDKLPREITLEKLESYDGLTVGKLKELLYKYNLPADGKVLVERISDRYFEQNNWGVVFKMGESWSNAKLFNENIENGEYDENVTPIPDEKMKLFMDQYHPSWYACKYDDDDKNLYICSHY